MASTCTRTLVAAIDFGTTFSGYGFSFKTSPDDVLMAKNWGAEVGFQSYKTPTSLLVDEHGQFKAFGYSAEHDYTNSVSPATETDDQEVVEGDPDPDDVLVTDLHLFKQFKMELHGKERLDKHVKLRATDGNYELPALDVFAMSLKFLKDHLIKAVNEPLKVPIKAADVQWVLTVPAIWSDVAKTFMKEAAHKAGLVDSTASDALLIALEPEAASLYCRTKDISQFVSHDGQLQKEKQQPGDTYMVIDAGGGTMDITVHEVQEEDHVKELSRATGGPWGGIYVDRKLTQLYDEVFGQAVMAKFREVHPNLWMTILLDWEQKKKGSNPKQQKPINLAINAQFADFYKDETGQKITAVIKAKRDCGVAFASGHLRILAETVDEMFNSVLQPTMEHLHDLLTQPKIKNIKCIFIVGGFGESKYLQERVITEFRTGNRAVLIPLDASLCVIKGAVLFGHNPKSITSRIARRTYCFKTTRKFDAKNDDPELRCPNDKSRIYYLRTLVEMNTEIPQEKEVRITTKALDAKQKSIKFTICSAAKEKVFNPSDKEVKEIGDLVIPITPTKNADERMVELIMRFGGTAMTVTAVHKHSNNKVAVDFDFADVS